MARPGAALLLTCCAAAMLWGCGLKTPVTPPDAAAPDRIRDLAAFQDETGVTLRWSAPARSRSGHRLGQVRGYTVLRAWSGFDSFCRQCPARFVPAARVPAAAGTGWRDPDLAPGRVYSYRVVAEMGPFVRSLPSNRADAAWDEPPPAPEPPVLKAGDHAVTVRIDPEGYGFELERKGPAGFAVILRRPEPGPPTRYTDREPANGEEAVYRLRLLKPAGASGLFVRGPASRTAAAVPRDLTPPPSVTGLTAVGTAAGVILFWTPVTAADLAGYRVYRRAGGRTAVIGETGPDLSRFPDRDPPAGAGAWEYRVSAFDRAGNESQPSGWQEFRRTE